MSIFPILWIVFSLCSYFGGTAESHQFPTTLKGFGYGFNDFDQLRKINRKTDSFTNQRYNSTVYSDASKNDAYNYAFWKVLTEYVYQRLLKIGLKKIYVPSPKTSTSSFVFATRNNFTNTKKLLILIQGSGLVRAGVWSGTLIINQTINHGTQIPYIKRAMRLGYDVLVTNTNYNSRTINNKRVPLKGNETPEKHINSVWKQLIAPVYKTIGSFTVVAHSYGGVVTLQMAKTHKKAFLEKCFAVAFTDSVHKAGSLSKDMFNWFRKHARNYVRSNKSLNTTLTSSEIPRFSAGHTNHQWTSWACKDALFPYLEEQHGKWLATKKHQKKNRKAGRK